MDENPPIYDLDPDRVRVSMLMKDPWFKTSDAPDEVSPMVEWMTWRDTPFVGDTATCEHGETVCMDCANEWSIDWHLRIYVDNNIVWSSPDAPPVEL